VDARAVEYADRYLAAAGLDEPGQEWTVRVGDSPGTVHITVTLPYQPRVLGLFGFPERPVTAHATAVLIRPPG
jgi:hypothetical protein